MSIFSSVTGIGLNPFGKTKVKIDPLKALATAATVGTMGGFGPIAGLASKIPGAGALSGLASKIGGMIPAPIANAGRGILNAVKGGGAPGAGGAAGSGGIDWGNILKEALGVTAGVTGYKTANAQSKQATDLTNQSLNIADRLAGNAGTMNARTAPIADASASGLLARLKQGARAPIDYNRFNDTSNPFTARFAPPAAASPAAASPAVAPSPAPVATSPVIPPPVPGALPIPRPKRLGPPLSRGN